MKRNRIIGRLLVFALALGMAMTLAPSLALPARAAGKPTPKITIIPNEYVSTPDDKAVEDGSELQNKLKTRFEAYQIFEGELGDDYDPTEPINELRDVHWGASIKSDKDSRQALINELSKDTKLARDLGITLDLMLRTKDKYLDQDPDGNPEQPFYYYTQAYNSPSNWQQSGEGGTVGGEPTAQGRVNLQNALNQDLATLTIGELFAAALENNVDAGHKTDGAYTASMVITDFTGPTGNVALARAFYAIVFARGNYDNGVGSYLYLDQSVATSTWAEGCWTIEINGLSAGARPDGYYMIRDTYPEKGDEANKGKANAAYMAGVFGSGDIYIKAEAPTVTKTFGNGITTANSGKGASYELGDTITFALKGTLPERYYTGYEGYPYVFKDTLAAGLTFGEITRVYVKVPTDGMFVPDDYYLVEEATGATGGNQGKGYRLEEEPQADGTTRVTISFPNLKYVHGKKVTSMSQTTWATERDERLIPITGESQIYVVYTAKLNENAVISDVNGNLNTVELYYANNPLWDPAAVADNGTWDSVWQEAPKGMVTDFARPYDFGVQLTVYGKKEAGETPTVGPETGETPTVEPETGESEERELVAGAGFALKKGSGNNVQYAILHKAKTPGYKEADTQSRAEYTYYLTGWVSEADWYSYLSGADTSTRTARAWGAPLEAGATIGGFTVPFAVSPLADDLEGAEPDAEGNYYAAVMTEKDGRVRIVGLKDNNSIYYLEEVISPDGYARVDDIRIQFTAGYSSDGTLNTLSAEASGSAVEAPSNPTIVNSRDFYGEYNSTYKELVARFTIYSDAAITVDTGGMGTTLFYIGGGALLTGAALILIISNAKGRKPEKCDR